MDANSLFSRQQQHVHRVLRLAKELSTGLLENRTRCSEQLAASAEQRADTREDLERQAREAAENLGDQLTQQLEAARLRFETEMGRLEQQRSRQSDAASRRRSEAITAAQEDAEHTVIQRKDRYDHDRKQLAERKAALATRCEQAAAELENTRLAAQSQWERRSVAFPAAEEPAVSSDANLWSSTLLRQFDAALLEIHEQLTAIGQRRSERYLRESWTVLVFIAALVGMAWPSGWITAYHPLAWLGVGLLSSLAVAAVAHALALRLVRNDLRRRAESVSGSLQHAAVALQQACKASQSEARAAKEEAERSLQEDLAATESARQQALRDAELEFQQATLALEQAYREQAAAYQQQWDQEASAVRAHFRPLQTQQQQFFHNLLHQTDEQYQVRRGRLESEAREIEQALVQRWQEAVTDCNRFSKSLQQICQEAHGGGAELDACVWRPPAVPAPALRLGEYALPVEDLAEPLRTTILPQPTPAVLGFPHHGSLVMLADTDAGRSKAIGALQNATLQYLASFPAGKVRLTIIDPIGLGQNFASFMHLADYDERLVGHRIWTESAPINQRLMDLTEHMENVIQKYLRNEFASIQDYNEHAGEVAEPFRVLVIAGFPHQFNEESTRRLLSILSSGPKCGVYTLMGIDTSVPLPKNLALDELAAAAQIFRWNAERFVPQTDPFSQLPLQLDAPPDDAVGSELIRKIGREAQETRRVQVPFSYVAPPGDELWRNVSDTELSVPLGRVGATQQLALRLGHGTSQHVLISGKTGSGKSNLLNALITNAALHYAPNQLQFYLIDFKKGVEFKAYAEYRLPHARVIAIESEREFGLSVLQRLDLELRRRGDQFREQRVQNLAAFRQRCPDTPLPRILLIVDEFQEFFINDDRVAHEASLLLDRLVRQGRAFGIHVILGSQTLAGAYSLARSTIGQMGVRIALECSAADAHLILSEDNSAARLLGRPGEAIYNDANGSVEGNHPFQVVWLPDELRNESLARIQERALIDASPAASAIEPPIIFEGHAAADLAENRQLAELWENAAPSAEPLPATAWLGAAIEIKDPTQVTFTRQGGSNLLIVGQSEELASGMLGSSILSLLGAGAAGDPASSPPAAQFLILDSTSAAGEPADRVEGWSGLLSTLRRQFPQQITITHPRGVEQTMARLAEQLEQRMADPHAAHPPTYLVIHDLARFRSLQSTGDNFGLGSFGGEAATDPAGQLARLLREGPSLGMHTLLWADAYHTLSRWLERASLRDFAHRIVTQMSAVDSSHLMDSAAAAQLGGYRAILYDHDRGTSEKFRPYAVTVPPWLQHAGASESVAGQ